MDQEERRCSWAKTHWYQLIVPMVHGAVRRWSSSTEMRKNLLSVSRDADHFDDQRVSVHSSVELEMKFQALQGASGVPYIATMVMGSYVNLCTMDCHMLKIVEACGQGHCDLIIAVLSSNPILSRRCGSGRWADLEFCTSQWWFEKCNPVQALAAAASGYGININQYRLLSFWQSMRKDENSVICCSTEVRFPLHELHTRRAGLFSHFLPYILYDRIIFGFLIVYIVCSSIFHVCSMFVHCLFLFCFHGGSVVAFFLALTKSRWLEIDSLRRAWPIILVMSFGRFWTSWCILTYFSSPLEPFVVFRCIWALLSLCWSILYESPPCTAPELELMLLRNPEILTSFHNGVQCVALELADDDRSYTVDRTNGWTTWNFTDVHLICGV